MTKECERCEGHGEVEWPISQDSFGNWDTVVGVCDHCDGTGKQTVPQLRRRPMDLNPDGAPNRWYSYR